VLLGAEKSDRRLTGNHFQTFIHAPQGMIHAAQSDGLAVTYQRHARDWDVSAWPAEGSAVERGAVALPRSSVSRVGSQIRPIPGAHRDDRGPPAPPGAVLRRPDHSRLHRSGQRSMFRRRTGRRHSAKSLIYNLEA